MRYHFSIFATLAGTPWTGFRRGAKLGSILAECGAPAAGKMGEPPAGGLAWARWTLLWAERPARRSRPRGPRRPPVRAVGRLPPAACS